MKLLKKLKLPLLSLFALFFGALLFNVSDCSAAQLYFSPIKQEKVLVPGTTDEITVRIGVADSASEPSEYELEVSPFSVDDDNNTHLEAKNDYSQIVDWITLPEEEKTGVLQPGEHKEVVFTVRVPKDAPSGGQYCAIVVRTFDKNDNGIGHAYNMTHMIYAEVAGETRRQGEISKLEVPSFLLSGNLTASASVKNLGNVHSNVKHVLKVFPLFGNEELYTNEEEPQENIVMPEATRYSTVTWENTPTVGIFRVEYSAEFEGVKNELSKIVIVCPIWLLVIILAILAIIIFRIVTWRPHRKSESRSEAA